MLHLCAMDTKTQIKQKARELFNRKGLLNVTLREVAKELERSYGNITYHAKTKERLMGELYEELQAELQAIGQQLQPGELLLRAILQAPEQTFDLSMKYLFFYRDYLEIRRHYSTLAAKIEADNAQRKARFLLVLQALQQQQQLRADLTASDLDYLMELSGAMRTFFFLQLTDSDLPRASLRRDYVHYVNRLLLPYLSELGRATYDDYLRVLLNTH